MKTKKTDQELYWQSNIKYLSILLGIWFVTTFIVSIIGVNYLNSIKIMGVKMGFWFAQQGSMYVYVLLIGCYVFLMNKLDKKYNLND